MALNENRSRHSCSDEVNSERRINDDIDKNSDENYEGSSDRRHDDSYNSIESGIFYKWRDLITF